MTAVGFEPTPPERPRPERGALDHSAKLSLPPRAEIEKYILEIKLKSMTHIILINLRLVFVFQRSLVRERRVGDIFIKRELGI